MFTPDLIYLMSNISTFVNANWYLGLPFNDTTNFRTAVAELGSEVLGDRLIGLQAGVRQRPFRRLFIIIIIIYFERGS